MKKVILLFIWLPCILFAQQDSLNTTILKKLEIPNIQPNEVVITHTGYVLSYNKTHKQANWVAYELTSEETNSIVGRSGKFTADPKIKTDIVKNKDYVKSGYDKGHLAPAGDMGWSLTAMTESFYFSNISPQVPSFNRGVWRKLEELVRSWAVENKSVYVVTGPVLTNGLSIIGDNKVSVPEYFYKVILDYNEPYVKGIGFIIPNNNSSEPLQYFAITIDSVEIFTHIDFFPLLPDEKENIIESTLKTDAWSW